MQKALYFIPDISGFTRFVNETEIEHSIHIIAELLETLLDNNPLGFKLAEIEGDALFMYSTELPPFDQFMTQIRRMLEEFHQHVYQYNHLRICDCGACQATIHLKLKFIIHYGNLNFIKVKKFKKPYGKDVIRVHRLLKNKIDLQEYILITKSVYELYKTEVGRLWEQASGTYDNQVLHYFYRNLDILKQRIVYRQPPTIRSRLAEPSFRLEKTIHAAPETIHALVRDWKIRQIWDKSVRRIEHSDTPLNRVGAKHTCILNKGSLNFLTIRHPNKTLLSYGETTDQLWPAKTYSFLMKFQKINDHTTQLVVEVYLEFSFFGALLRDRLTKRLTAKWETKLENLYQLSIGRD